MLNNGFKLKMLMKVGWKLRKLWHFKVSQFVQNIFENIDMNMQMSELIISYTHYLSYILYIEIGNMLMFCPNFW